MYHRAEAEAAQSSRTWIVLIIFLFNVRTIFCNSIERKIKIHNLPRRNHPRTIVVLCEQCAIVFVNIKSPIMP